jgi:hypothetical protein
MESEGIYLLREREFVRLNEDVYKIGRSSNIKNRMNNYPKSSNIELMIGCQDSVGVEKALLEIFRKEFKQMKEYGSEYFQGDKLEMIKIITNFVNNKTKVIEKPKNTKSIDNFIISTTKLVDSIESTNNIIAANVDIELFINDMNILEYKDKLYWMDKNNNIYEIISDNQIGKKIGLYNKKMQTIEIYI